MLNCAMREQSATFTLGDMPQMERPVLQQEEGKEKKGMEGEPVDKGFHPQH